MQFFSAATPETYAAAPCGVNGWTVERAAFASGFCRPLAEPGAEKVVHFRAAKPL
jgi:hypothetical protein